MNSILFTVFGIISFVICITFLLWSLCTYKSKRKTQRILSAIQLYTIGVFISLVLLFIPVFYTDFRFGDGHSYIRPFLIAVQYSLRVFILDADFETVVNALRDQDTVLHVLYSLYSACLYVVAPLLTFGIVLSLFKNIKDEIRFKLHLRKKHYVMSELNEKSVALAKSIYDGNFDGIIVFAKAFDNNGEVDVNLLTKARELNAVCLKKDISNLNFMGKKGSVEIFLISNDESENVSRAVKLTTELNQKNSKNNVKIFVFSTKPGASYIIDSIRYDNLLQHAIENGFGEDCFKLRRINERQLLIRNTVPTMKLFELANKHENTLSVMIVGFGSYGMEFFKMLVWYCQFEGYKLQINIIDKLGKNENGKSYIESLIDRDCPELLKKNCHDSNSDARYDIRIFPGVDVLTSDINDLLLSGGVYSDNEALSERIKATNLAFVSLGDDDVNIEVSIRLRSLFDRIHGIKANKYIGWKDEVVDIYSIVYDDEKSEVLYKDGSADNVSNLLLNHKNVPYHIHFIGSMSDQFDYSNVYDSDLEKSSYIHHRSWVDIEERIYNEWLSAGDQVNLKNHEWYFSNEQTADAAAEARKKFEQYEYYRLSSIAKELYQREIKNNSFLLSETVCLEKEKKQTCKCVNCVRRKKSEHQRWIAYTRVTGYEYKDGIRADRAFLHDNLCDWYEVSELDRQKD